MLAFVLALVKTRLKLFFVYVSGGGTPAISAWLHSGYVLVTFYKLNATVGPKF